LDQCQRQQGEGEEKKLHSISYFILTTTCELHTPSREKKGVFFVFVFCGGSGSTSYATRLTAEGEERKKKKGRDFNFLTFLSTLHNTLGPIASNGCGSAHRRKKKGVKEKKTFAGGN